MVQRLLKRQIKAARRYNDRVSDLTIPVDALLGSRALEAGLEAMERIHGRHLAQMSPAEQAEARAHWRAQVEHVLGAARGALAAPLPGEGGRATITFSDAPGETVEVGVVFEPELLDLGDGTVQATPAQMLAMSALESIEDGAQEP